MRSISSSSGIYPGLLEPELVAEMAAAGCRAVELLFAPGRFDYERPEYVAALQAACRNSGIAVASVHLPFGGEIDLSDASPRRRERSLDAMRRAVPVAASLGARVMVVHACTKLPPGADREAGLRRCIENFREIAALLPEGTVLAVENLPPGYLCSDAGEMAAVLEALDPSRVGFCLDTGHAALGGEMAALLDRCGGRLVNLHLHDNLGDGDFHLPPGEGTIDWDDLQRRLDRIGYRGLLTCEVLELRDPAVRRELLRRLGCGGYPLS